MLSPRALVLTLSVALAAGFFPAHVAHGAALSEAGRPFMTNYPPGVYRGASQMWGMAQAPDGLLYFGNNEKIFEFDGLTWRKLAVPGTYVRQLAFGADGQLYVGGTDEIGFFHRAADGGMTYHSLLPDLPTGAAPLGIVTNVVPLGDAVFFSTFGGKVLRWRGGKFTLWSAPEPKIAWLSVADSTLYLHRDYLGLFRLRGDEFELVSRDRTILDSHLVSVASGDPGTPIVMVREGKLATLQPDGTLAPWQPEATAAFVPARFRIALRLADGTLALATDTMGVLHLARDGRLIERIDGSSGLDNEAIHALFQDREGALWISTNHGVSRVELSSPYSVFDHANGLALDEVMDFCRHDGTLYAASNNYLLRLVPIDPATGGTAHFERVPLDNAFIWALASHRSGLVLGGVAGVALLDGTRMTWLTKKFDRVDRLVWSRTDPDLLFVDRELGLGFLRYVDGAWREEGSLTGFNGDAGTLVEDGDTLWVGTQTRGIVRVTRPAGDRDWARATFTTYFQNHGLPKPQGRTSVYATSSGPVFTPRTGAYRFNAATDTFEPDARFCPDGRLDAQIKCLTQAPDGTTWLQSEVPDDDNSIRINALTPTATGFTWEPYPRILETAIGYGGAQTIWREITPAGESTVWVSGADATVRITLARPRSTPPPWKVLFRSFQLPGAPPPGPGVPRLPYSHDPIAVSFAANRFGSGGAHTFQTRLLGFDDKWSAWSPKTEVSFTNLTGGPFTLEVRARDLDGRVSDSARYTFAVAPPWHLSNWAFVGYGVLALGAVAGFLRWRLRHVTRDRLRLEQLVADRTAELAVAKDQAEAASRAKTVFLASMSHELRTPLNGVIGYAQVIMNDRELSVKNRERIRIVQTSGEHLLRMINEVLDFSKIEAGRMELHPAPFHLPQLLRDIAAAISTRAEQKELAFVFAPAPDLPEVVVGDSQKLRQVIDNLLSNAIKFTARGEVRLQASVVGDDRIAFSVSDTGVGISDADREKLFQPFQQAADGRPPEPGTGLGLAISQRLVALMDSRLVVESRSGAGSCFSFDVRLPALVVDTTESGRPARAITGYAGARRTLLLVDDVAVNRHVLRDLLQPVGFEILEAASGESALASAAPDLAFIDLRMPGMDGLELVRRLRAREGGDRVKLVAMSASVLSFNRDDAFAAGCDDFLPKPFREAELLEKLGRLLHLEWSYAPEAPAPKRGSGTPFAELSSQLDSPTLAVLLAFAQRGEILALRERLAALRASHSDSFLDTLDAMARSYRMEQIRELLERQLAARPSTA